MSRIGNYIKDTRAEMRHVSWPTRRQSIVFTIIVMAISLFVAAYLGLFDFVFSKLLQLIIS